MYPPGQYPSPYPVRDPSAGQFACTNPNCTEAHRWVPVEFPVMEHATLVVPVICRACRCEMARQD